MTKSLTNTPTPKYLPTNDVIFKCLLGNPGNERITKSFLEHITGEEIEEISTNFKLELLKEKPKEKQMVADLIAKDKYLQKYIVEMKQKGLAEGIAEGLEAGIAQGEKRTNLKIVRKMLEKKMDINLISELTGLTEEEIKSLL